MTSRSTTTCCRGARTSVKARKPSAGKVASVDASTPLRPLRECLPLRSTVITYSQGLSPRRYATPRAARISQEARAACRLPAVQIRRGHVSPKKQRHAIGGVVSSAEGAITLPESFLWNREHPCQEGEVVSPSRREGDVLLKGRAGHEVALEVTPTPCPNLWARNAEEGTDGDDEMDVGGQEDTEEAGGLSGWLDDSPLPNPLVSRGRARRCRALPRSVFASVNGPAANALGDNTPVAASAHDDVAIFYVDSDIDEVVEEASEPTDKATDLQARADTKSSSTS
ncbi:hypothetical protein IMY05_C4646000300 [Salix suchowensis]|nr:hypothetical protein IMY05_C4646000300 [Salix suchowensis]